MSKHYISPGFRNRTLPPLVEPAKTSADAFRTAFGLNNRKDTVPPVSLPATAKVRNSLSPDITAVAEEPTPTKSTDSPTYSKNDTRHETRNNKSVSAVAPQKATPDLQKPSTATSAFSSLGSALGTATKAVYRSVQTTVPNASATANNKLVLDRYNESQWYDKYGIMNSADAYAAADQLPNGSEKEWLTDYAMLLDAFEHTDVDPLDPTYKDSVLAAFCALQLARGEPYFKEKQQNDYRNASTVKQQYYAQWGDTPDPSFEPTDSELEVMLNQYNADLATAQLQYQNYYKQAMEHEKDYAHVNDTMVSAEARLKIAEITNEVLTEENQIALGKKALEVLIDSNQALQRSYDNCFMDTGSPDGELLSPEVYKEKLAAYNNFMSELEESHQWIFDIDEYIRRLENSKINEKLLSFWEEFVKSNPVKSGLSRIVMSAEDFIATPMQALSDSANHSRYMIGDPNGPGHRFGDMANILDREIVSRLQAYGTPGKISSLAYQAGMHVLDEHVVPGAVGSAQFLLSGLNAYGDAYRDAARNGYPKWSASAKGIVAASLDAIDEKLSNTVLGDEEKIHEILVSLTDGLKKQDIAVSQIELNFLSTLLSSTVNSLDEANYNQKVSDLMAAEGYTKAEAEDVILRKLIMDHLDQMIQAYLSPVS